MKKNTFESSPKLKLLNDQIILWNKHFIRLFAYVYSSSTVTQKVTHPGFE